MAITHPKPSNKFVFVWYALHEGITRYYNGRWQQNDQFVTEFVSHQINFSSLAKLTWPG